MISPKEGQCSIQGTLVVFLLQFVPGWCLNTKNSFHSSSLAWFNTPLKQLKLDGGAVGLVFGFIGLRILKYPLSKEV